MINQDFIDGESTKEKRIMEMINNFHAEESPKDDLFDQLSEADHALVLDRLCQNDYYSPNYFDGGQLWCYYQS